MIFEPRGHVARSMLGLSILSCSKRSNSKRSSRTSVATFNHKNNIKMLRPKYNAYYFVNNIFKCTFHRSQLVVWCLLIINTLRPRQNGRHFQFFFLNENLGYAIRISLKFVPKVPINDKPALVTNDGIFHWRIYASLGLNELMESCIIQLGSSSLEMLRTSFPTMEHA